MTAIELNNVIFSYNSASRPSAEQNNKGNNENNATFVGKESNGNSADFVAKNADGNCDSNSSSNSNSSAFRSFDDEKFAYGFDEQESVNGFDEQKFSDAAIKGLTLSVEKGEFVALLGRNGSGKSTLARLLNGLLLPNSGEVKIFGLSTSDSKNLFEIRKSLGIVFQNPDNQMIATIIEDDIAFGPENIGVPPEDIEKRISFALDAVGMSAHRKETASRLSGGQKQRVAIAGILALRPKIIVFDESTAMLDPVGRREIMNVIKGLRQTDDLTVILITHYMEEAAQASRVIVLENGKIALDGSPAEVFAKDEQLSNMGLSVPVATKICKFVKRAGFDMPEKGVLNNEQLVEALCRLKH